MMNLKAIDLIKINCNTCVAIINANVLNMLDIHC